MGRVSAAFRRRYGASGGHLVVLLASFAVTAYAGVRLLAGDALGVALWIVGAAVLHDLVLLPLYSLVDRGLRALPRPRWRRPGTGPRTDGRPARTGPAWANAVRVPAFLSGLLLLVWFPLISGRTAERYAETAAMPATVFLERWLAVSAVLFAASGLWLAVRVSLSHRSRRRPNDAAGNDPGDGTDAA